MKHVKKITQQKIINAFIKKSLKTFLNAYFFAVLQKQIKIFTIFILE
jgi:hypothetical protein